MSKLYLTTCPRKKAQELFLRRFPCKDQIERIPLPQALGRITASPIIARNSFPAIPCAAMDGIAVCAASTFAATDQQPLHLVTEGKDWVPIDTGDPLPRGFDAVIMREELQPAEEGYLILHPAHPYQHVRPVGEDVVAGEVIVPAYHPLTPPDLGVILAGGILEVEVLKKPRVAIIPTGDELVVPGEIVQKGEIPEFNSTVLAAYVSQWGGEPVVFPIVKDDLELLCSTVESAIEEADIVLVNAGSSAGREDFTVSIPERLGEVLVHGVAARPGKPTVLGIVRGKPFVGVPGYPVSAYLCAEWFVRPLIFRWFHQPEPERSRLPVTLGKKIASESGSEEFVRVSIGCVNGVFIANPLPRGAGVTMSLVKADGLLTIPPNVTGYAEGETVEAELFYPVQVLERTILSVGSHDMALDLLSSALKRIDPSLRFSSFNAGSMGAILALRKGEAHLGGIHLFDSETESYNIPFIEKYLQGQDIVLVHLVYRSQGFMVEKGNPKGVHGIRDIVEKNLSYINRQKGAGTRILLDYMLQKEGIPADTLSGYTREEYSHLSVAAAVASGTADAGLGIYSAAKVFQLDFIPVCEEPFELLLSGSFFNSAIGEKLMDAILDDWFKKEVEALGGYSTRETGNIRYPSHFSKNSVF